MKLILTENVENVGKIGELVTVARGFARNYLIPRKLAMEATEKQVKVLDHQIRTIEHKIKRQVAEAGEVAKRLEELSLTIAMQAGEENKLFGSVTTMTIQDALKAEGFEIDRKKILLEEPIKALGIYAVPIKLHAEVVANLKVWVVKE